MDVLFNALYERRHGPWDTVVHLGAGPRCVDDHRSAAIRRLVLVEGDPDSFSELAACASAQGASVQAIQAVVLPHAGPVDWHRCNLRRWNGPRSVEPLLSVYPRLQTSEPMLLAGVSLLELLRTLELPDLPTSANALIMDLPGQEANLLAALPAELLTRFNWIALRGSSNVQGAGWGTLADAEVVLCQHGFEHEAIGRDLADPIWPVALFHLDRARHGLSHLQQALDAQTRRAEEAEQALERRLGELEPLHAAAVDQVTRLNAELSLLTERCESAEVQLSTQQSATQGAIQELEQLHKRVQELEARASASEARRTAAEAKLAALQGEVATLTNRLTAAQADVAQAQRSGRDTIARLEDEAAQLRLRQRLMDDEIVKAEGQIELIKDVLLREPGL